MQTVGAKMASAHEGAKVTRPLTEAQARLCEENVKLVHFTIKSKFGAFVEKFGYDELLSAGMMGLLKAAAGYDQKSGFAFSGYAVRGIAFSIYTYLKDCRMKWGHVTLYGDVTASTKYTENNEDDLDIVMKLATATGHERGYIRAENAMMYESMMSRVSLTPKEQEVYGYLLRGDMMKRAAEDMKISGSRSRQLKEAVIRKMRRAGTEMMDELYGRDNFSADN